MALATGNGGRRSAAASALLYLAAAYGSYGVEPYRGRLPGRILDDLLRRRPVRLIHPGAETPAGGCRFVAASQQSNFAVGALAGGLLAYLSGGPALGLYINGLSFVISAVFPAGSEGWSTTAAPRTPLFLLTEAMDGLWYIWAERRLRCHDDRRGCPQFVMGSSKATLCPLVLCDPGTTNNAAIGLLVAAMGVGGLIGALMAPRSSGRQGWGGP